MKLTTQPPFFDRPDYIEALATSAEPALAQEFDHLLFSFHGLPERQLRKSDPTGRHCLTAPDCCTVKSDAHPFCYRHQCYETARLLAARLALPQTKWSVSFQSRLGKDPWLKPYTDFELERLPKEGVKRLLIICPAFVSDCLETIEEIGMRGRDTFMQAGGASYTMIPCLNEHPVWIAVLERMVRGFLEGAH